MIEIEEVVLHRLQMPLQMRFETSFGVQTDRDVILAELRAADGWVGWGESVALRSPWYSEETTDSVWDFLINEAIPRILETTWDHPREFTHTMQKIHGNFMAKFTVEGALWDIWAQQQHQPLARVLGGTKTRVAVGVSIGIKPLEDLLDEVGQYVEAGYQRIKIKVKPGWDLEPIQAIRRAFPAVSLMVDANTAYGSEHLNILRAFDDWNLLMIEQPFPTEAWELSAHTQHLLKTPICLDESICTLGDARRAIEMKACQIINVKLGRIGGIQPALDLAQLAEAHNVQLWCGGMLETGIGRSFNIAIATLSGFTLPGDTAASQRYWKPDIIVPEVTVNAGHITVPDIPGRGFEVNRELVNRYQWVQRHFRQGQTGNFWRW